MSKIISMCWQPHGWSIRLEERTFEKTNNGESIETSKTIATLAIIQNPKDALETLQALASLSELLRGEG